MSTKSLGRLTLDLLVNTAGFSQGMDAAERDLDRSTRRMEQQARQRSEAIKGAFLEMAKGIAAPLAAAFSVSALAGATRELANQGAELVKFAKLTGTTVEEFQRLAAGAKSTGIEMDKLADIYKDVGDKVGDYLTTGGGALADFFEGVGKQAGLTAEQFRHLSGPQALGLIFSTLEQSGASRNEMIFWMEALAGDASLLIPLLENNAAGFKKLGDEAERAGIILSTQAAEAAAEFKRNLGQLGDAASGVETIIAMELLPVLNEVVKELTDFGKESGTAELAAAALRTVLETVVLIGSDVSFIFKGIGREIGGISAQAVALATLDLDAFSFIRQEMIADAERARQELEAFQERVINAGKAIKQAGAETAVSLAPVIVSTTKLVSTSTQVATATRKVADATKGYTEILKRNHEEAMSAAKADQELIDLAREGLESLEAQLVAQQEFNEEIGVTGRALAELKARRLEEAAAQHEQTAAMIAATPGNEAQVEAYRRKAEVLREIATLQRDGAKLEEAEDFKSGVADMATSIENDLSDALMRAFEDGKGFAESLRDTLKNYFNTMVLRPLLAPVSAGIAGAVSGQATGSGGLGGTALSTLGTAIGSMFGAGGISGALMAGAGWMTGATTLGGSLAAAGSLMGTGTAAGLMSGAAMGIGAALPILLPLAIFALSKKKPSNKAAWGEVDIGTGELFNFGNMTGKKQASQETMQARDAFLQSLGIVGTSLGAKGKIKVDVGERDGIQIDMGEGMKSYGRDMNKAMRDVFEKMLADTEGTASQYREVIESMLYEADKIPTMLSILGDNFSGLMTDAEKFAAAQKAVNDGFNAFGLNMPRTIAEFRNMADSLDLTTAEGREMYGAMYQLQGGFAELARVIEDTLRQINKTTADSIRQIEMSVLDDKGKYEFLDDQIEAGLASLKMATDPAEIQQLFSQINSDAMAAWNLLSIEEQKRLSDAFIARIQEIDTLASERLSVTPLDADPVDIEAAIERGLQNMAERLAAASQSQEAAADKVVDVAGLLAAAVGNIPDSIVVQNTVNVTVPEVGGR